MKRLLLAAALMAAAATVAAGLVGVTAAPAKASGCDSGGIPWDNGYYHNGLIGTGNSFSADVTNGGSVIEGSSSYENWANEFVGVSSSNGAWLEAGLLDDISTTFMGTSFTSQLPTSGFERYIAYDIPGDAPVLHVYDTTSINTPYLATITHVGTADWTAKIGSSDTVKDIPITFSGSSIESQFLTNTINTNAAECNALAFKFTNLNPWYITDPLQEVESGPYTVTETSSDSFTVAGN